MRRKIYNQLLTELSHVVQVRAEGSKAPSPGRMAKTCENSGVNAPGTHVPYFRASCGLTNR